MEFTDGQRKLIRETLEKLTIGGKGVTSIILYEKIGSFLKMEQKEFQPKLSRAINSDEIPGYIGRKRAGYFRSDEPKVQKPEVQQVSKPALEEPEDIQISNGVRIRYSEGNWSIEKKIIVGEAFSPIKAKEENVGQERWVPVPAYYGSLSQAAEGLLTRHINLLGVPVMTHLDNAKELQELLRVVREGIASVKSAIQAPKNSSQAA